MLEFFLRFLKPGLHVRLKHKNKHKHKHKDVYTCDKHKHNVTYASAEANKFASAIAQPGCRVARVKPGSDTCDASISISTSISTRNLRVNRCDASISALCLRLCLCLRRPGLHVRRNDASISTSTREWNDSCACAYACVFASYV